MRLGGAVVHDTPYCVHVLANVPSQRIFGRVGLCTVGVVGSRNLEMEQFCSIFSTVLLMNRKMVS